MCDCVTRRRHMLEEEEEEKGHKETQDHEDSEDCHLLENYMDMCGPTMTVKMCAQPICRAEDEVIGNGKVIEVVGDGEVLEAGCYTDFTNCGPSCPCDRGSCATAFDNTNYGACYINGTVTCDYFKGCQAESSCIFPPEGYDGTQTPPEGYMSLNQMAYLDFMGYEEFGNCAYTYCYVEGEPSCELDTSYCDYCSDENNDWRCNGVNVTDAKLPEGVTVYDETAFIQCAVVSCQYPSFFLPEPLPHGCVANTRINRCDQCVFEEGGCDEGIFLPGDIR